MRIRTSRLKIARHLVRYNEAYAVCYITIDSAILLVVKCGTCAQAVKESSNPASIKNDTAVAAVLFYLYIYLMFFRTRPSRDASTRAFTTISTNLCSV